MPTAVHMPDFLADIGEGSVAVVVIENVLSARQARRPAGDQDSLVSAGAILGQGRGLQIEVDVVGDEEIEMAVAVVVDEGAAGVPANLRPGLDQAGLLRSHR